MINTSEWRGPNSLPDRVVCVLHSEKPTGCSSLNVGDLVIKHLHTRNTSACHRSTTGWCVYCPVKEYVFYVLSQDSKSVSFPESWDFTYSTELLALVSHLFPYRPAFRSQEISEVDGVDGRASLLIQSGLLANPVKDLPVQRAVVIQEGLQLQQEDCEVYWGGSGPPTMSLVR